MADFVACGRCSFFISGYRVIHGVDELKQAAEGSDEQWLALDWDLETRRLVQSSYGARLDIDFYYFDGRCPECQRRYVIGVAESAEEPEYAGAENEVEAAEPSILRLELTIT